MSNQVCVSKLVFVHLNSFDFGLLVVSMLVYALFLFQDALSPPAGLSQPSVEFTSFSNVQDFCAKEFDYLVLIAFGTAWSQPSLDSCRYFKLFFIVFKIN
jgi:hypothetical protein